MGINAPEVEAVAIKAARLGAFVAVPLAQRYGPSAKRARRPETTDVLVELARDAPLD